MTRVRFLKDYQNHRAGEVYDVGRAHNVDAMVRADICVYEAADERGDIFSVGQDGIVNGPSQADVNNNYVLRADNTWVEVSGLPGSGSETYHITRASGSRTRNVLPTIAEIQAWQNPFDSNNTTYSSSTLMAGDYCVVTHHDSTQEMFRCTSASPETWVQVSIAHNHHFLNSELFNEPTGPGGVYPETLIASGGEHVTEHDHNYNGHSWVNIGNSLNFAVKKRSGTDNVDVTLAATTAAGWFLQYADTIGTPITSYFNCDNSVTELSWSGALGTSLLTLNSSGSSQNARLYAALGPSGSETAEAEVQITELPVSSGNLGVKIVTDAIWNNTATVGQVLKLQNTLEVGNPVGHIEFENETLALATIEDEGTPTVTNATVLNFTGANVTVTDAGGGEATITISGGGGSSGAPSAFSGALVKLTSDVTSITSGTIIGWDSEVYDTDAWHDNVTNNSRLTVPAGVTRVQVRCGLWFAQATGYAQARLFKNGVAFDGGFLWRAHHDDSASTNLIATGLCSAPLEVVEGDYFELQCASGSSRTLESNNETWFAIEALGVEKHITQEIVPYDTVVTTGDGKSYITIPESIGGLNLTNVDINVGGVKPVGSTIQVQLHRLRAASAGAASRTGVDMLSTVVSIDAGEWDSKDAATPPVINTSNDDVSEGDLIRVDIDAVGSSTAGEGLFIRLGFS